MRFKENIKMRFERASDEKNGNSKELPFLDTKLEISLAGVFIRRIQQHLLWQPLFLESLVPGHGSML